MRVRVKICGITDARGLDAAIEAGADAVGFVLAPSVRQVTPHRAAELAAALPPLVSAVALFRVPGERDVEGALRVFAFDLVQADAEALAARPNVGARILPTFHDGPGVLEAMRLWRASARSAAVLLDGPASGAGRPADWGRAAEAAGEGPLVLAGGLTPDNVGEAIARVRPYGVDVSSGVESAPGRKDPKRIAAFVAAVREGAPA